MTTPADPTDALLAEQSPPSHLGARALRDAWALLRTGDLAAAVDHTRTARRLGLPAELEPHACAITAVALIRTDDLSGAVSVLEDGWRQYPDFAALPALLACTAALMGRHPEASRAFAAALAGDDPDRSLELYRRELARLCARILS